MAVGKDLFLDDLRDVDLRGLPNPSESVEPENRKLFEILGPPLGLVKRGFLQAIPSIPVSTTTTMQDERIGIGVWPTSGPSRSVA